MSEPGWTKGPWERRKAMNFDVWASRGGLIATVFPDCHYTIYSGYVDAAAVTEAEANARLIAAAPTMAEYVWKRAEAGDAEAVAIWEKINASR